MALALVVDDLRVFLVGAEVVGTGGVLQLGNRVRRPHVLFATGTPGVFAPRIQHGGQDRVVAESGGVHAEGFFGDLKHTDTAHSAGGAGEILVDGLAVDADGLEQLRTAVRHVSRDAHLGHDLGQALADRLDVVVNGFFGRQVARQLFVQCSQGFHGQVGVHGFGAVTGQHSKVVNFAGGAGLNH